MPSTLHADGIRAGYGERTVLQGVGLRLAEAHVTTLIGPNGSGKSTLLRVLGRLMAPAAGAVVLDGGDIAAMSPRDVARRIATLRQTAEVPAGVTVEELVELGRYPHRGMLGSTAECRDAVEWAIDVAGLARLRHRTVDTLSGGERQRAWIAMALAQRTGVLLLDEPTTHLDVRAQLDVLDLVRTLAHEHGITVGCVLHDLNSALAHSDRVVALRDGRIVAAGPPAAVMTAEVVSAVFDVDVAVLTDPHTGAPICVPRLPASTTKEELP
jgi:ABC-type cobalamin/Fe3+-siderophores transport system ATPase subunit